MQCPCTRQDGPNLLVKQKMWEQGTHFIFGPRLRHQPYLRVILTKSGDSDFYFMVTAHCTLPFSLTIPRDPGVRFPPLCPYFRHLVLSMDHFRELPGVKFRLLGSTKGPLHYLWTTSGISAVEFCHLGPCSGHLVLSTEHLW